MSEDTDEMTWQESWMQSIPVHVRCDRCDSEWAAPLDPIIFAAMSNAYGSTAVLGRITGHPYVLRCPACLLHYGDGRDD